MNAAPSIGFLVHPGEESLVSAGAERARAHGFRVWTGVHAPEEAVEEHAAAMALLVTVGGDGTFLYGARLAGPRGIPLLGVNRGRLGFLTDVQIADLPACLDAFAAGRHTTERRTMLSVVSGGQPEGDLPLLDVVALNEVAMKAQGVNVVRIRVEAGGELLGEFDCDGVVVATATGSTAYALSAGGPPIDPRVRAIVVVPLAPHAVMTRAVVIPEAMAVELRAVAGRVNVAGDRRPEVALPDGGHVTVRAGPDLEVVRFEGAPSFLRRLRQKLHFGTPLKGLDHPGVRGAATTTGGS